MAIKLQLRTLRRNVVRRHRKVGRGPRGGRPRFTFHKSEHQARHSQFAHWLSRWPAGLVRDRSGPSSIRRERSNKTKLPKGLIDHDRAEQRCKCRLVCEWVCTVTSVSVRIEKRANCAKNNKPKSGGLFLVNARPFPEHSSSRATFSAGRAWLEATAWYESFCMHSMPGFPTSLFSSQRCSSEHFFAARGHFFFFFAARVLPSES